MNINIAIIEDEPVIARNLEFTVKELYPEINVLNKMESVKSSVT